LLQKLIEIDPCVDFFWGSKFLNLWYFAKQDLSLCKKTAPPIGGTIVDLHYSFVGSRLVVEVSGYTDEKSKRRCLMPLV
jgi:hypothetical protein